MLRSTGRYMKQLFFSPLSGAVYFGNGKPLKNNPKASVITGEKIDVTQSFYSCLFQKFPPGGKYGITDEDGKPLYELEIKAVDDKAAKEKTARGKEGL